MCWKLGKRFSRKSSTFYIGISVTMVIALLLSCYWRNAQLLLSTLGHIGFVDHNTEMKHSIALLNTVKTRIIKWQGNKLHAIDSQRIFMHEITDYDQMDVRKSCAVESAAKHNPNRSVQLFIRLPLNVSKDNELIAPINHRSPLKRVLAHYSNLKIIFYHDQEYFNNTVFANWYENGNWRKSPNVLHPLFDYVSMLSMFRGGGLFINHNAVLTLKPLTGPMWRNFFVKSSVQGGKKAKHKIRSDIMHLIYGHHFSDEIIINLLQGIYDHRVSLHPVFAADAVEASLTDICGGLIENNKCLDIHLLEQHEIFLPQMYLPLWHPFLREKDKKKKNYVVDSNTIQSFLKDIMDALEVSFFDWKSLVETNSNRKVPLYRELYKALFSENCPQTFVHFFK